MAGNLAVPNNFATQSGNVPASELDANNNAIEDYVNTREITVSTLASRPVAGVAGRYFFASDVSGGTLYVDTGSAWVQISSSVTPSTSGGPTQTFRNLYVRTDPDETQAANRVMLVSADEIVMDDGTRVALWSQQVADVTVAGANGLDTGSRVASTWYEIYAIRKSSDGTKGLLLHRMKNFFLDQTVQANDDNTANLRDVASGFDKLAQGFTPAVTGLLPYVDLYLVLNGALASQMWVELQSSSGGLPSNTVIATSDKVATGSAAGPFWYRFYFRTPPTVTAATQYQIVLNGNWADSNVNNMGWRYDAAGSGYVGGDVGSSTDGTTWVASAGADFLFREFVIRNDSAVSMPAGYDQSARIGQVYNNASNVFLPFLQRDRHTVLSRDVNLPFGFGPVSVTGQADQTATVDLYVPTVESGNVPWNARRVWVHPEPAYSAAPAAFAVATVRIRAVSSDSDILHVAVTASNTVNPGGVTGAVGLNFPDDASQQFRWTLLSSDAATANKALIISVAAYDWT